MDGFDDDSDAERETLRRCFFDDEEEEILFENLFDDDDDVMIFDISESSLGAATDRRSLDFDFDRVVAKRGFTVDVLEEEELEDEDRDFDEWDGELLVRLLISLALELQRPRRVGVEDALRERGGCGGDIGPRFLLTEDFSWRRMGLRLRLRLRLRDRERLRLLPYFSFLSNKSFFGCFLL